MSIAPVEAPLLRDQASRRLRAAILTGELPPGSAIRPTELAARLGLSPMPVREALARLRDEGLVETRPRSGTWVSPLRVDDARQALAVIAGMHELAVRTAVPLVDDGQLGRIADAAKRFERAVRAGDHEAAIAADDDFHGVFVEVAGNRPLAETIERYLPILRRAEALRFGTPPGRASGAAHTQILGAARSRDVEAAVVATRANWESLAEQIERSRGDRDAD